MSAMSNTTRLREPRPYLRAVICGAIGVSLLGSAYQSAFARSAGQVQRVGVAGTYGGGGDDDDDGLSTGAKIGIGIGVGAAVAGAAYGLGYIGPKADKDDSSAALPGSADRYSAIRVAASEAPLAAGESRTVALLGQGVDGKWYRVDQRREASLEIKSPTSAVVKQDGSRNVFCVPLTASRTCDGEAVTVVGKFRNPDGKVVSAETVIQVRVPAL